MSEQQQQPENSVQFTRDNPITQDLNYQVQDLGDNDSRVTVVCLTTGLVAWTRFFSSKSGVNPKRAAEIAWDVLRRDGSPGQVDKFIAVEAVEG